MAQKTAVDWLFEQIPAEWTSTKYAFDAYQQAKQMEKEQQSNTAHDFYYGKYSLKNFDEYYNETFGK